MKKSTTILIRVLAVVLLLAIGGVMMVIGRGHTIYFDNKTFEYEGKTYEAAYKITCYEGGEKFAKLMKRERGMVDVMGQKAKITLEIENQKGDQPVEKQITLDIPYNWDGMVINLSAYLNDLPLDVYMEKFVPAVVEETPEETEAADEFGLAGMEG